MPQIQWPLQHGRPSVEVVLTIAPGSQPLSRSLLADTGAGSQMSAFELILDEDDCLLCGGSPDQTVNFGGAYSGAFPTYILLVQIPPLGFAHNIRAVGVPSPPDGFDGIACFSFLNRFHYGNFTDPGIFGLES